MVEKVEKIKIENVELNELFIKLENENILLQKQLKQLMTHTKSAEE